MAEFPLLEGCPRRKELELTRMLAYGFEMEDGKMLRLSQGLEIR